MFSVKRLNTILPGCGRVRQVIIAAVESSLIIAHTLCLALFQLKEKLCSLGWHRNCVT